MSRSAHFSVTTAGALVLGGIAALVLATVIAFSSSHRRASGAPVNPPQATPGTRALPRPAASTDETEVEYQLDTND